MLNPGAGAGYRSITLAATTKNIRQQQDASTKIDDCYKSEFTLAVQREASFAVNQESPSSSSKRSFPLLVKFRHSRVPKTMRL